MATSLAKPRSSSPEVACLFASERRIFGSLGEMRRTDCAVAMALAIPGHGAVENPSIWAWRPAHNRRIPCRFLIAGGHHAPTLKEPPVRRRSDHLEEIFREPPKVTMGTQVPVDLDSGGTEPVGVHAR